MIAVEQIPIQLAGKIFGEGNRNGAQGDHRHIIDDPVVGVWRENADPAAGPRTPFAQLRLRLRDILCQQRVRMFDHLAALKRINSGFQGRQTADQLAKIQFSAFNAFFATVMSGLCL